MNWQQIAAVFAGAVAGNLVAWLIAGIVHRYQRRKAWAELERRAAIDAEKIMDKWREDIAEAKRVAAVPVEYVDREELRRRFPKPEGR